LVVLGAASACSSGGDDAAPATVATESPATSTPGPASTAPDVEEPPARTSPVIDPDDPDLPPVIAALASSTQAAPDAWTGVGDIPTFISPGFRPEAEDPAAAALEYLGTFADAYGVADPNARFEVVRTSVTRAGTVVRVAQTLDGLEVFAGELAVRIDADGRVGGITGVVVPDADLAEPTLDASEATAIAVALEDGSRAGADEPRLVAFSPAVDATSPAPPVPAWAVVVRAAGPIPLEDLVIVSAVDGAILLRAGLTVDAENWTILDARNAVDDEGERDLSDAEVVVRARDGVVETIGEPVQVALDLAANLTTTYEYFLGTHGLDGYDGAGGECRAWVRVGQFWFNASANDDCDMFYGDARPYASEVDVVAHEFTHAVSGGIAGFVYEGESGALDEHYSDFFAVMIDRTDWRISPTSRRLDRAVVDRVDEFLVTTDDKGGVHTNSGIGNTVGFLVASDGTNTHRDTGIEVRGIGRDTAETLWFASLYSLSPRVTYPAWACSLLNTARVMSNVGALTVDDVDSVEDALVAVGLLEPPDETDPLAPPQCLANPVGSPAGPDDAPDLDEGTPGEQDPDGPDGPDDPDGDGEDQDEQAVCQIVGTWELRSQQFLDEILARTPNESGATLDHVGGAYLLQLNADGTSVSTRAGWQLRAAVPEGAAVIQIDSVDPGTWDAEEQTLTVTESPSSATVSIFLELDGQLIPAPFGSEIGFETPAVGGTGTFTCVDDVLTVSLTLEGGAFALEFDRIG
jgi:Zn-dependent metalloprotease